MSTSGHTVQQQQQLQQDLQNELTSTNQLLRLISIELQKIKHFTASGGELESNILKNASLIENLARLQHVDLQNLPSVARSRYEEGNGNMSP
ncbi:unnamed protein product [Parnassius apollo]|uniref:(apollo) hypothetical protein n=1 Tax=Parnassius apollo TaxID=110799 RepID=A0A8S3WF47_PARAO|nr:unnamed protein product [Parnassius apollo]